MADKKITALTVGVPIATDVIPYVSDPGGSPVTKKTLVSSLATPNVKLAGDVVQVVRGEYTAVDTTATTFPLDDTKPQNTEGKEILTQAITPTSATNKLFVQVVTHLSLNQANFVIAALFQDTAANSLNVGLSTCAANGYLYTVYFSHYMTAGTTSATTFKLRYGSNGGTTTINGGGGGRYFGGVLVTSITIWEIQV
jgi:hypothetical protein